MFFGFIRARLQRRLFVWFTLGMVFTGLSVAFTSGLLTHMGGHLGRGSWFWDGTYGAGSFLEEEFADVWSQPAARDRLAERLARDFSLQISLRDAQGQSLGHFGGTGGKVWSTLSIRAGAAGAVVGVVEVAGAGLTQGRSLLTLGVAALTIWFFAGVVSRRLARPYYLLAQVARDLGAGRLRVRAPVRRQFGEARLLAHAINEMAERIERQLKEQRELLAAVSHELRTPLSRLRLLVELARTGPPSPKLLDDMDQEAMEMDRLVGELLASARIEFGTLSMTALEPRDLALRALERAGLPATLLEVEPDVPRVRADATLLLRALANLLDNGRQHGSGVTRLHLSLERGEVVFGVEDSGPGLAPGDADRLFQPFQRGHKGDASTALGLGLGLSLVQRIARAHGGSARASNRPGGGAVFELRLPLQLA